MMCGSDAEALRVTNSCNVCICGHFVMFDVLSVCYIVTLDGRKRSKWF